MTAARTTGLAWNTALNDYGVVSDTTETDMLRADAGRTLGFSRVVAQKT